MNETHPQHETHHAPQRQTLSIPVAIIIAGALIAFGIYWSGRGTVVQAPAGQNVPQPSVTSIKPIGPNDHVLGNPNAKMVIVEYSDTECPFCKQFHNTLHDLMTTYKGDLAWVFRYFPVHSKSVNEGEAQECAAELGGNEAFWKFTDKVFEQTNSNDSLDPAALPQIAASIGLDVEKFKTCLSSGKYAAKITQDRTDVTSAGAQGTPYSVIFSRGQKIPLSQGALPYADMKNILDTVLKGS